MSACPYHSLKSFAARGYRLEPTCQLSQDAVRSALNCQAGHVAASLPFLQDVVWERLDDTTGNTQFLRADFCPYGSQSLQEQVAAAAQLAQEAFSSVVPPQRPQGKLAVLAACTGRLLTCLTIWGQGRLHAVQGRQLPQVSESIADLCSAVHAYSPRPSPTQAELCG